MQKAECRNAEWLLPPERQIAPLDPLHIPLIMCRGGPCGRPPVLIRVAARVAPTNCIFSSYYFESLYRRN